MQAIFMANGANFSAGEIIPMLESVNLYNLFCAILRIDCAVNDGTETNDGFHKIFQIS